MACKRPAAFLHAFKKAWRASSAVTRSKDPALWRAMLRAPDSELGKVEEEPHLSCFFAIELHLWLWLCHLHACAGTLRLGTVWDGLQELQQVRCT